MRNSYLAKLGLTTGMLACLCGAWLLAETGGVEETSDSASSRRVSLEGAIAALPELYEWWFVFNDEKEVDDELDREVSVAFAPENRIYVVMEWGYTYRSDPLKEDWVVLEGRYEMDHEGVITADLVKYPGNWPLMAIRRSEDGIHLHALTPHEAPESSSDPALPVVIPDWPIKCTTASIKDRKKRREYYTLCSCCGHEAVDDLMYGMEVCLVCYWQVDRVLDRSKPRSNGVNFRWAEGEYENRLREWESTPSVFNLNLTVTEARRNFRAFGAIHDRLRDYVVNEDERGKFKPAKDDD